MDSKIIGNSIVIINTGIEPQNFNSYWLVKNNLIEEEELSNENVFSKHFVHLNGEYYDVLINGNSIQFQLKNDNLDKFELLIKKIQLFNAKVQNTINVSMGINFNWILDLPKNEYVQLSKKLFYNDNNPIHKLFEDERTCFGSYISKDFEKSRLKLDIKPILLSNDFYDGTLNFNFNFHFDLNDENRKDLDEILDSWNLYFEEAKKIINSI
jgi:hypothetical protein